MSPPPPPPESSHGAWTRSTAALGRDRFLILRIELSTRKKACRVFYGGQFAAGDSLLSIAKRCYQERLLTIW